MSDLWERLTAVQPAPAQGVVELMGVLAIGLVAWGPTWRVLRQVVTVVHEASHALVAVLVGRSLNGVRLHRDASGLTVSRGMPRGPGVTAMLAAGYTGPALLGLLGAWVLGKGYATALLWAILLVLVLLVVWIRNAYGLLVLLACGAVMVLVTWKASGEVQTTFAYLLMWFLLLAAPRTVLDLQRARSRGRGYDSDADQLGRLSALPAPVWVLLFGLVTVGSLLLGAYSMLDRLH